MPDPIKIATGALTGLVGLALIVGIYMLISFCVAAYIKNLADRTKSKSWWYKFPKWLVPNKPLHDWVGYPSTYSTQTGSEAAAYSVLTGQDNTLSNAVITDCMLKCGDEKCKGIVFTSANTCYLVSSMDGIIASATGNTFYSKSEFPPTKQFTKFAGKILKDPVPKTITLAQVTSNVVQVTTSTPHEFINGDTVLIRQGTTGSMIDVISNVVTVVDTTTFKMPFIRADGVLETPPGQTAVALRKLSTIPIATGVASYTACASNCVSQGNCTGFGFKDGFCAMFTVPIDTTKDLVAPAAATAAYDLYVSQPPVLVDSGQSYY